MALPAGEEWRRNLALAELAITLPDWENLVEAAFIALVAPLAR
jgi:hypothetical protein